MTLIFWTMMLQAAHNNASVYLHAVFARPGNPTSPREQDFDPEAIFWKTHGGQSEAALHGCHGTSHIKCMGAAPPAAL